MDDRRSNHGFASRPLLVASVPVGADVLGLTLHGNQSAQHAHRRLTVLAQREYGISLRDIHSASPLLTLLLPDDSLFGCFAYFYQTVASPAPRPACIGVHPPSPSVVMANLPVHLLEGAEMSAHCGVPPTSSHVPSPPGLPVSGPSVGLASGAPSPPPPSGHTLSDLTSALRARVSLRTARFPMSLRNLRVACGAPACGDSWPPLLSSALLDRVTALLDADDALLALYHRALEQDRRDPVLASNLATHSAARSFAHPDAHTSLTFAGCAAARCLPPAAIAMLRMGLVPCGAWAALAALRAHVPGMDPEVRVMLGLVDGSAPTPWAGPHSLSCLAATMLACLRDIDDMGVHLDASLILRPLVAMLLSSPSCPDAEVWRALLFRSRSLLGK